MRSIFLSLLAATIFTAAIPVLAAGDTFYGSRLNVSTIFDDTSTPSNIVPNEDFISYMQKSPEVFPDWFFRYLQVELYRGQESPVWMPDGKGIAFSAYCGSGIYTIPLEGGTPHLVYINWHTPGTNPEREPLGGGDLTPLCYTPDGKELTYMEYIYDESRGSWMTEKDGMVSSVYHLIPVIRCINLETGAIRTIIDVGTDGYWSPDGRYFAFYTYDVGDNFGKNGRAVVRDMQTGENIIEKQNGWSMCFTPDSKYIIYSKLSDPADFHSINLYRMPVAGGESEQLTFFNKDSDCYDPIDPAISPSGEWILFSGRFTEMDQMYQGLCVLNTKTGKTYKAFPEAGLQTMKAKWSPDGKKFVYMSKGESQNAAVGPMEHMYVFDFQPTPFQKATGVESASSSPSAFAITGNYPNPFNPSTTISFTLPASGAASLAIYSVTGQMVRELVSGPMSAGVHSVVWDGRDGSGKPVSSGVYLSRLTMGNHTSANRMLLAK